MKDSGVAWIGEIPEEWTVRRLKNFASIQNGMDYRKVFDEGGEFPVIGSGGAFAHASQFMYDKTSVLLGRKGTVDKPIFIDCPFWTVDTMYYTVIHEDVSPRYFYYLCTQIPFTYFSYGSAVPSMTQRDLNSVHFPYPPKTEQEAMATYLDECCESLQETIDEAQNLVDKLTAYKQSLITEAVTKGLHPEVARKDSGVSWIGEIPRTSIVVPLTKKIAQIVDYRGKTPEKVNDGIFLVTAKNIKDGIIDYALSQEYIRPEDYDTVMSRGKPKIGDVLFTTEAPLGEVANVDREDIALAQRVIKFTPTEEANPYYLKYWMMHQGFQQFLQSLSTGSTAAGIKASKLFMLKMVLHPLDEQRKIVSFLDAKCAAIDADIARRRKLIERLSAYRRSLIYEVVTGKREVAGD
ncbi:restriction endonuclease subunit S [Selenomonas sp.]|uniref:restriction endonuclease subunit S n=1 Tax=Selenomonas sp. TaxID=2053611 RepID=UPI002A816850|nr:restriction endonuclease subunit S [Selenomonas sp.]MDY4415253.1 restriction endonuclease subunit S [Selenomonas sp.]